MYFTLEDGDQRREAGGGVGANAAPSKVWQTNNSYSFVFLIADMLCPSHNKGVWVLRKRGKRKLEKEKERDRKWIELGAIEICLQVYAYSWKHWLVKKVHNASSLTDLSTRQFLDGETRALSSAPLPKQKSFKKL